MSSTSDTGTKPATSASTNPHDVQDKLLLSDQQFPLLLAIAKDDVADAAIRVTEALAQSRGARPAVVQVFDPTPYAPPPMIGPMMVFAESLIGPAATTERCQEITAHIERVCGHPVTWPVTSRLGDPTTCIADEAQKRGSQLLVVGLHHHGKLERLLGTETTVQLMTNAGIPVLAVTREMSGLPRRMLVAVDFGQASIRMARLAARLVEPSGAIVLAYVQGVALSPETEDLDGYEVIRREGVAAAFEKLVREIAPAPGVEVTTVVLTGEPASALLTHAEEMQPDLIAVASQRKSRTTRLLLGSVSRTIIRDSRWSVFVTPP